MNITKSSQTYLITALVLTVTFVTGCASAVKAPMGLRTDRKSAGGVEVKSVNLATTKSGQRVSGKVGCMIGYASSRRRHLDVKVIGANGAVLAHVATSFSPNPIQHNPRFRSGSAYGVTVPLVPPPGSVVHVAVHETLLADCGN